MVQERVVQRVLILVSEWNMVDFFGWEENDSLLFKKKVFAIVEESEGLKF